MKGARIIFHVLKKLLIFLVVIMLSSSLFVMASGFTIAEVKSNVGINISDSENALIGIDSIINGGTIQKVISPEAAGYLPVSSNIDVVIKNNMNTVISVNGTISSNNSDILLERDGISNSIEIGPGSSGIMTFIATANPQTHAGVKIINMTFNANWNGGNAIIQNQMNIEVIEPVLTNNNSLLNTSPFAMELQESPIYVGVQQVEENKNSYADNNLKINNQTWVGILRNQHTMTESHEAVETDGSKDNTIQNDSYKEAERQRNEESAAELYQRCILVSNNVGNRIEEINIYLGNSNSCQVGMDSQQRALDNSMFVELHQEYSKLYSSLQLLINAISDRVKDESAINDSDIINFMQQVQSLEINYEYLNQIYMTLIAG